MKILILKYILKKKVRLGTYLLKNVSFNIRVTISLGIGSVCTR